MPPSLYANIFSYVDIVLTRLTISLMLGLSLDFHLRIMAERAAKMICMAIDLTDAW